MQSRRITHAHVYCARGHVQRGTGNHKSRIHQPPGSDNSLGRNRGREPRDLSRWKSADFAGPVVRQAPPERRRAEIGDAMNGKNGTGYVVAQVVMIVLFLVTAFVIAVFVPGDAKTKLKMSIGYGLLVLTFLFGLGILVEIIRGNIDISGLLGEA